MLFKELEFKPQVVPEHTYWLIRCVELEFAQAFIEKGSMKFAHPSDWCEFDGTSRGDILEGTYASQRGPHPDPELDQFLKRLRKDIFTIEIGDFTFYKSKEIISYRAHCLYGLNSNILHFQERRSQDHQFHKVGKVPKEYFSNLFPRVKEAEIDLLEPNKKPAVLFLKPDSFVDFVKTRLEERGVKEEEILIRPVSYFDYYSKPFIIANDPEELFNKNIIYSGQSEVRIVVDTRRKVVRDLFDKRGVIELGPVDKSIASISEFYFNDIEVEIRGNTLLYSLARPEEYEIDEVDDTSLINILEQALSDELPGAPMCIERIEKEMGIIMRVLGQRDPAAKYDSATNILYYKGFQRDLGATAGAKMLEHYNIYISDGDIGSAGETIAKFKYFFPKYDMGNYFSAYYKAINKS